MYLHKTIGNMIAILGFGFLNYIFEALEVIVRVGRSMRGFENFPLLLIFLALTGVALFGGLSLKTLTLYIKYRDIGKDIKNIGEALMYALKEEGAIQTNLNKLKVVSVKDTMGSVFCHLEGGTSAEKSIFIKALKEVVAPVENPRYIIIRKSKLWMFFKQRDYHSVPEILGKNKKLAMYFQTRWKRNVGGCDLVFTRTPEGRKLLLKSRMKSLAVNIGGEKIEPVTKWR